MDRLAARAALALAVVSIVLNVALLKRQPVRAEAVAAAPSAPAPERAADPASHVVAASPTGLAEEDVRAVARAEQAKREEAICASVWPRVVRLLERERRPKAAMPKTVDGLLILLLAGPGEDDSFLSVEDARFRSLVTHCKNNLKQLGIYVALFESKYRGDEPTGWDELRRPDLITDPKLLHCHLDGPGDECSYEYIWPFLAEDTPPETVVAYDKRAHSDGKRCVLHYQGNVDEMTEAELKEALEAQAQKEHDAIPDAITKVRSEASDPGADAEKRHRGLKKLEMLGRR